MNRRRGREGMSAPLTRASIPEGVLILDESQIRELVGPREAREAVAEGFSALSDGRVTLPAVIEFDFPEQQGETHLKAAHVHGSPFYTAKVASGFYANRTKGLPTGSGLVLVFDAATGFLRALLFDNGYLTDLRTGAAGAVAADVLARPDVRVAAIIGAGVQGRYQLEALLGVRRPANVLVYDQDVSRSAAYVDEMQSRTDAGLRAAASVEEAVRAADVVITCTPARRPYLRAEWLSPGTHITAMGSDMPLKQELDVAVLRRADKVVTDSLEQCLAGGETHHAVEAGVITRDDVYAELGEITSGKKRGRADDREITVADLTGVGVQDAAVASLVVERALGRRS
jgi:ornithine cyclodeaminase/alanine dehydrogenase-like protein (mu-crystallin family)